MHVHVCVGSKDKVDAKWANDGCGGESDIGHGLGSKRFPNHQVIFDDAGSRCPCIR